MKTALFILIVVVELYPIWGSLLFFLFSNKLGNILSTSEHGGLIGIHGAFSLAIAMTWCYALFSSAPVEQSGQTLAQSINTIQSIAGWMSLGADISFASLIIIKPQYNLAESFMYGLFGTFGFALALALVVVFISGFVGLCQGIFEGLVHNLDI